MKTKKVPYISLGDGRRFTPTRLRDMDFRIEDIAHALSREYRFSNFGSPQISVAQHCLEVSWRCSPENALVGLMHDASEAFLRDIASPIKNLPELKGYRQLENRVMRAIAKQHGFQWPIPKEVKRVDHEVTLLEYAAVVEPGKGCNDLNYYHYLWWEGRVERERWAYAGFLERYEELASPA